MVKWECLDCRALLDYKAKKVCVFDYVVWIKVVWLFKKKILFLWFTSSRYLQRQCLIRWSKPVLWLFLNISIFFKVTRVSMAVEVNVVILACKVKLDRMVVKVKIENLTKKSKTRTQIENVGSTPNTLKLTVCNKLNLIEINCQA